MYMQHSEELNQADQSEPRRQMVLKRKAALLEVIFPFCCHDKYIHNTHLSDGKETYFTVEIIM